MNITNEVITLRRMSVGQLQDRYVEEFGEAVRSRHKQYLVRRIAWRRHARPHGARIRSQGACRSP